MDWPCQALNQRPSALEGGRLALRFVEVVWWKWACFYHVFHISQSSDLQSNNWEIIVECKKYQHCNQNLNVCVCVKYISAVFCRIFFHNTFRSLCCCAEKKAYEISWQAFTMSSHRVKQAMHISRLRINGTGATEYPLPSTHWHVQGLITLQMCPKLLEKKMLGTSTFDINHKC